MGRVGSMAAAAGVAFLAAACAVVPATFEVTMPGRELVDPVQVVVVDKVGIVTRVAPGQGGGPGIEGALQVWGEPGVLHVAWLGGMCDRRTTLTIEDRGGTLAISEVTDRADSCLLAGVLREVAIGISRPVDPSTVVFEPALGRE